jgi:hypothetical protein
MPWLFCFAIAIIGGNADDSDLKDGVVCVQKINIMHMQNLCLNSWKQKKSKKVCDRKDWIA